MGMETLFQALDELDDLVEIAGRRLLLYFNSSSTSSMRVVPTLRTAEYRRRPCQKNSPLRGAMARS
jgi:hypothetical protein